MIVSPSEAYPAHDRPAADDISRPQDRCDVLHQNFTAQAQLTPDAIAIVASDGQLTYRQLEESSNQLARLLRARGVQRNALVGIALERSLDMAIAILGIAKAGGAYLPLDPAYPIDRLAYMVNDSGLSIVLTHERFVVRLPQDSSLLLLMDRDRSEAAKFSNEALEDRNTPQDIAYCIYTSGSTGLPKGTLISHGAICNMLWWFADYLHLTPNDRIISIAAFSFDASVQEFWPALFVGGCSVLSDPAATRDPEILYRELTNHRITMMTIVPSLLTVLLENPDVVALSHLRHVFSAGEALPGSLRDRFYQYCDAQLHNAYGPTETAICATCGPCRRDDTSPNVGIGKPIRNVSVYVLDDKLTPLSPGIAGELYIGGAGVAIAYLGRPDLTAERFPPNPFGPPGTKLYRTGDLARWRDDGTIEYLGRADRQVKINGIRIEIGEIEAALNGLEPVSTAAVAVQRRARDQLVAFVVADADRLQNGLADVDSATRESDAARISFFDEVFTKSAAAPGFEGWNDSYTGAAIPLEIMEEWRQRTVDRIMACAPKRVLELGCGSGLLLEKIAPKVETYRATDISPIGIAKLSAWVGQRPDFVNVSLSAQEAIDFHGIENDTYDIVVINSVVLYFPNMAYLKAVLDQAKKVLRPGGRIFVGDVRSAPLLILFHTSIQELRATPASRLEQLSTWIERAAAQDDELVVDPEFFRQLVVNGDFATAETQLKEATFDNELSRYRYDVILSVDKSRGEAATDPVPWNSSVADLSSLASILAMRPVCLRVTGIPNRRLADDLVKRNWIAANPSAAMAEMRAALAPANVAGEDPNAFWDLARAHGYEATVSWSSEGSTGSFDVEFQNRKAETGSRSVFRPAVSPVGTPDVDWEKFGNNPALARLKRQLPSWLRDRLERTLPGHMLPARIFILDGMPLTTSGKLDYEALAQTKWEETEFVPAETNIERSLVDIWQKVLGVQPIGITARWFDLGGDSILGLQAVARARSNGVNLSVADLFQHPTIADLAAILLTRVSQPVQSLSIPRISREGALPVSFGQAGLAFISHLQPEGRTLNYCNSIKLHGSLDIQVLESAFCALVERHEILRTTFATDSSGIEHPLIHEALPQRIAIERWTKSKPPSNDDLYNITDTEAQTAFDLGKGPLLRLKLLEISPKENILFICFHHIIFDGWSLNILLDELACFYFGLIQSGRQPPLPKLAVQFVDCAAWERQQLTEELAAKQMTYWREKLAGEPPAAMLPLRDKSGVGKRKFGFHSVTLGAERTSTLREFARAYGATTSMVLLATFKTLLHRLTGQEDLWVGVPTSTRTIEEIEKVIGFFVNMQVLRTQPAGKTSFSKYLDQIKRTVLEAQNARELPFNKIVQALQPHRDVFRNPLVEVMYNYRKGERNRRNWVNNTLDIEIIDGVFGEATYDFSIELEESTGDILFVFQYATNIYSCNTIKSWAASWLSLLDDALARPEVALGQLRLQTDEQRSLILQWGAGEHCPVPPVCLHALIEQQAERTPDMAAVIFEGQQLSYGELNRRANRLAHFLRGAGVGPDTMVAICVERSLEMVVGVLGILKAGGAYVPLDPAYPQDRLTFMLNDSAPKVVLTGAAARAALEPVIAGLQNRPPMLDLVVDSEAWATEPVQNIIPSDIGLTPQHLAYVIYTSGSTGVPKGVMVEHGSVINYLVWACSAYRLQEGQGAPVNTSLAFDATVTSLLAPLASGKSITLLPEGESELAALGQALQGPQRFSLVKLTPAHLDVLDGMDVSLEPGQGANAFIIGGEALTPRHVACWRRRAPHIRLINEYGPTEATVGMVVYEVSPEGDIRDNVPIGRPIANTRVYLLDETLRPVPQGITGEIHIGGVGVARGYLNRSELTAERFIASPFVEGDRLYKTGDLGRWRRDGDIEYLGRNDFQVKIRGFRIELGEIEAQLLSREEVREAVVTARETPHGKQLVGYVTGSGHDSLEGRLQAHLKASLPSHMVPSRIIVLERLPLSPNGKLDRKALPEPGWSERQEGQEGYVPPRTELERHLVAIWQEVLGIPQVGITDDFFALGGHSLLALMAISRIQQQLNNKTSVRDIFNYPNIEQLSRHLEETNSDKSVGPTIEEMDSLLSDLEGR